MTNKIYRPKGSDERTQLMEQMIEDRIREDATLDVIAQRYGVCQRTVRRWKATDEWRAIETRWRRIMREEGRTEIGESIKGAVEVLNELAHDKSVTAFTRMSSARALLEFSGVDQEIEETKVDQHDELLEFLKQVEKRPSISAKIMDIPVLDGGLLPPEISGLADVVDAEYTQVESNVDSLDTEVGE
jgi:hypothetical protein